MASHDDDPRDLLLAYRAQQGPPPRAAADNWQQLVRRIDAGEPAPALAFAEPPPRPASSSSRVWAYGLLAAAAAALITARFVWPERFSIRGRDAAAAAPYLHEPDAREQPVQAPAPRPSLVPAAPVPADIPTAPVAQPAPQRPAPVAMPERPADETDLARELATVRAAGQAVRDGDGAAALRHADDYLAAHPRGSLVPEARLRRIEALCLLARPNDARREVDAFLVDYPHSPLRERARAACNSSHEIGEPRPLPDR
ncbi:hypothetical protein [Nannocystis radixulma]|uniref:Outer membrane lipoprotein BamD-like domain-containing protein n=1 Tax=Nannocystis radixulma TaxID=2995305 RepID=A0ABT5B9U9_9BACT|nr:hypothetical protein [Nannocystis radixulma]MDC0670909.1 hypothetical protein [Nannocystis radixulma]